MNIRFGSIRKQFAVFQGIFVCELVCIRSSSKQFRFNVPSFELFYLFIYSKPFFSTRNAANFQTGNCRKIKFMFNFLEQIVSKIIYWKCERCAILVHPVVMENMCILNNVIRTKKKWTFFRTQRSQPLNQRRYIRMKLWRTYTSFNASSAFHALAAASRSIRRSSCFPITSTIMLGHQH